MKRIIITLLLLLSINSCGIFQPRESFEIPEVTTVVDRFCFGSIFDSLEKNFTWKNYETFFADTFKYTDLHSGEYSRSRFIEGLQQLVREFPRFTIKWYGIKDFSEEGSTLIIQEISYEITEDSTAATKQLFTGTSKMVIIRDGEYRMVSWDDFPDRESGSFLAPVD